MPSALAPMTPFARRAPHAAALVEPATGLATGPAPRRPSVLIVEDDAIIAIDMELAFEDAGFEVIGPAADEAQALALIRTRRPDFAALDWNLRTGTSAGIAEALARVGTRFVFVTATGADIAYDGPVAPVFSKPADPRCVAQALAA